MCVKPLTGRACCCSDRRAVEAEDLKQLASVKLAISDTFMTLNEYQNSSALMVRDALNCDEVTQSKLHCALINAMNRIAQLEQRLAKVERSAHQTNDMASCLANGIKPD